MRLFGKKSVTSAIGLCLAISWYAFIILMAATLCLAAMFLRMDDRN
jgi:hypothetical protein